MCILEVFSVFSPENGFREKKNLILNLKNNLCAYITFWVLRKA